MTEENNQDKNQNEHDSVEPESASVPPVSYEVDSIPCLLYTSPSPRDS